MEKKKKKPQRRRRHRKRKIRDTTQHITTFNQQRANQLPCCVCFFFRGEAATRNGATQLDIFVFIIAFHCYKCV